MPVRFAGSVRDVTEQHLFDEALRQSESRHRLIAETVNDIIWEADLPHWKEDAAGGPPWDLHITYVSPAIERVLGYSQSEALAMPIHQMLTPESFTRCTEIMLSEMAADVVTPDPTRQREVELEFVSKNGAIRLCEVRSVFTRDPHGFPRGVLGVSRDITERKQAEIALCASQEQWRSLVEHAPDTILTIDRRHRITFVNRPLPPNENPGDLGTTPYDGLPAAEADRVRAILEDVFERGQAAYYETAGILRTPANTWFGCRVGPLRSDGEVVALIMIATDITARRRSEQAPAQGALAAAATRRSPRTRAAARFLRNPRWPRPTHHRLADALGGSQRVARQTLRRGAG